MVWHVVVVVPDAGWTQKKPLPPAMLVLLLGVTATCALELGIDVGALETAPEEEAVADA